MHHYEAKMCLKFPAKAKDLPRFCSTTKVEETKATSVLLTEKKSFVIPSKSFVKIGKTNIFCYNNKMFSSINKTLGCCSEIFGCSNKKNICS